MKFLICTIPLRDIPTYAPPLGVYRICKSLNDNGYNDIDFYHLDQVRANDAQIIEYVKKSNPDVIGLSAVVSTSYAYVKKLCLLLKSHFPNKPIILGGNMAASANVLLNKCKIDLCVIGEGEEIIVNLFKYFEKYGQFVPSDELKKIKGICFYDSSKPEGVFFTGYAAEIPLDKIENINYDWIKKQGWLEKYLIDPAKHIHFARDPRFLDPKRSGKKLALLYTTKGCTARCTFCHRWTKGYKRFSVDGVIQEIKDLMKNYNVGFIQIQDENFGAIKSHLMEFIEKIKPLDILWKAAGVRVVSIDGEIAMRAREAGCVSLEYGVESGSDVMLDIMEKKAMVSDNFKAMQALRDANLWTALQLVIGMPGETNETIGQTLDFLKFSVDTFADDFKIGFSCCYAQALPGTPLYEYLLQNHKIKSGIDGEEEYLMHISNTNAVSAKHYINATSERSLDVYSWQFKLWAEYHLQYKKNQKSGKAPAGEKLSMRHGFRLNLYRYFPKLALAIAATMTYYKSTESIAKTLLMVLGLNDSPVKTPSKSLRKYMSQYNEVKNLSGMDLIRKGR